MSYQRPHISLGPGGELVGVFWSPPFEGPLRAPREEIGAYYAAYSALHGAIERAPCTRHRLQPGEVLVFNNRRMLHGRDGFAGEGVRHLRGCYVNIDEFANRFNLLRRKYVPGAGGASSADPPLPLGNQDWALGRSVGLPDAPCGCGLYDL